MYLWILNTMHEFISSLCWTYILPSSGFLVATSTWCRCAGWGLLVDMSIRGRLGAYLPCLCFYFGVLASSALTRMSRILFYLSDYVWGTIEFSRLMYMRFWLYDVLRFFFAYLCILWSMNVLDYWWSGPLKLYV